MIFALFGPFGLIPYLVIYCLLVYGLNYEGYSVLASVIIALWLELGIIVLAFTVLFKHLHAHVNAQGLSE